jgi:hypothetical protein
MPAPPQGLRGQLVEHVPCEVVTFDLGSPPPPATFRLFDSMPGIKAATSNSGTFIVGIMFVVTENDVNLDGYWQWCCPTGMPTIGLPYALWSRTVPYNGVNVPAGTVTGGTMNAGVWNFVELPAPVPLTNGQYYRACVSYGAGMPFQTDWWGPGDPGYAGLQNGPLTAPSGQDGDNPVPGGDYQMSYVNSGSDDPTVNYPNTNASDFMGWLDVQVSTGS